MLNTIGQQTKPAFGAVLIPRIDVLDENRKQVITPGLCTIYGDTFTVETGEGKTIKGLAIPGTEHYELILRSIKSNIADKEKTENDLVKKIASHCIRARYIDDKNINCSDSATLIQKRKNFFDSIINGNGSTKKTTSNNNPKKRF